MNKILKQTLIAATIAGLMSGCATQDFNPSKTDLATGAGALGGAVLGRVLGGSAGNKNVLMLVGAAAGAWAGHALGEKWDAQDKAKNAAALKAVLDAKAPVALLPAQVDQAEAGKAKTVDGVRMSEMTAKDGTKVAYYESDANGKPAVTKVPVAQVKKHHHPKKVAAAQAASQNQPVDIQSAVVNTAPAAPAPAPQAGMKQTATPAAPAAPQFIQVSMAGTPAPAPASIDGDCKYIAQKITTQDGQEHAGRATKFCRGANGEWAPAQAQI